jgi:membrane-associated phospholipid phosphatase
LLSGERRQASFNRVRDIPGKLGHVGSYLPVLQEIRSGHWTVLSYAHAEGIVTFPSFHTTLAVFFAYLAGRLDKRLLRVFGPVNAIMLLSIPVIGGHYLADLFGGAAVACVSIVAVRLIQTALAAAPISVRRPEIRRAIDPIIGS